MNVGDLLQYDDPVVFGKDPCDRIVGVHLVEDSDGIPSMAVYRRNAADEVVLSYERVHPFLHVADTKSLGSVSRSSYKGLKLGGTGHFGFLISCPTYKALYGVRRKVRDWAENTGFKGTPEHTIHDKVQQYLVQSGRTYFKGMDFQGPKRLYIDIEAYGPTGFPNASRRTNHVFIVSFATNRGMEKALYVGREDLYTPEERAGEYANMEACADEETLLRRTNEIVMAEDPDVICGHNLLAFDLPYLEERMARYNLQMAWGRDGTVADTMEKPAKFKAAERDIEYPKRTFAGRSIIDTMFAAMSYDVIKRTLPGYGLKVVAQHFGVSPEDRTYVPGDEIASTWDSDPRRLIDYALDDVRETAGIDEQLGQATFFLSHMVPLSYQEVALSGTGRKIEGILVREYVRMRYSLPAADMRKRKHLVGPGIKIDDEGPRDEATGGKSLQEVGGYTDVYMTGRIENVIYADVASLYPSIMIHFNVEPEGDDLKVFQGSLKRATALRFQVKGMMADHEKGSAEYVLLDAFQSALKTFINSMYGLLGFLFALFNDYVEADRVTTIGQKLVKRMAKIITGDGGMVVEVDTDGVLAVPPPFVYREDQHEALLASLPRAGRTKESFTGDGFYVREAANGILPAGTDAIIYVTENAEGGIEHRDAVSDKAYVQSMTERVPTGIEIDFDGRAEVMMSLKRKNYALMEPSKDGLTVAEGGGDLKLKGGSFRNRTIQQFRRDFMKTVIEAILRRDPETIHNAYCQAYTKVVTHSWTPDEFMRRGTVKDTIAEYEKKVKLGHGRGGRNRDAAYELAKHRADKTGIEVRTGDRISYYVGPPQDGRKKALVYKDGRFAEEWDPERPDENTDYYLEALKESCERFRVFFKPTDYDRLFSTQTDMFFRYEDVEIQTRDVVRVPLKVIIAGSRGIDSQWWIERAMAGAKFLREMTDGPKNLGCVPHGFEVSEVICGMARGADLQGKEWAERNGIAVRRMPADWDKFGKSAGPRRNAEMAEVADALVLVWDGKSRGSLDMLNRMRAMGKPVHVSLVEESKLPRYRGISVPD